MQRVAGVDMRDIERLSHDLNIDVAEEILSVVRRGQNPHVLDVTHEVAEATGVPLGDVESFFNVIYQDHRITIDKDGFVKLVDGRKVRSRAVRHMPSFGNLHGCIRVATDRLAVPLWVKDPHIWICARNSIGSKLRASQSRDFWKRAIALYRELGGRITRLHSHVSQFSPRPFDVHPSVWSVSSDSVLSRDIQDVQAMIAAGGDPEDVENDMVANGADRTEARGFVSKALATAPLI